MAAYSRSDRVAEQIRRDLAELIQFELKDPRVGMISLTAVEVTPDYAHAKVFYSSLADDKINSIQQGLDRSSHFLRRQLGKRIHLHTLPELHFIHDQSLAYGDNLNQLIKEACAKEAIDNDSDGSTETATNS